MSGTVVLCGSLGSTSVMWEPQLPALEGRRVVKVEHPGHGGAPVTEARAVEDLAAHVLAQTGPGTFSVVGLSLGGAVGMRVALDAPERVERLVLASTAARFGEPEGWHERARRSASAAWRRSSTRCSPAGSRLRSAVSGGSARCSCRAIPRATRAAAKRSQSWDVRDELARDRGADPGHLRLRGSRDALGRRERRSLPEFPGARFEVIAGAAHLANVERPEQFNRLLEEHL